MPDLLYQIGGYDFYYDFTPPFAHVQSDALPVTTKAKLMDVHNDRLAEMDANHVDLMVLSCILPCIQGISDPDEAAHMAVKVNDKMASQISNQTDRFRGFASLAMHNASVASAELRRAINDLGFVGVMLNDWQQSGADGNTPLYYSDPQYDEFWATLQELDVPLYLHPRLNIPTSINPPFVRTLYFTGVANHIVALCATGVFDRFPKAKLIIGHLGERITSDLFRIDAELRRQPGMSMSKDLSFYFRHNIWETTSFDFDTELTKYHIKQIGIDRIMYSVDYPFMPIANGTDYLNQMSRILRKRDFSSLMRDNAIRLLKLD